MPDHSRSQPNLEPATPPSEKGADSRHRLFLVDDPCLLRDALPDLLERQKDLTVVGVSHYSNSLYQKIGRALPDMVIIDAFTDGCEGMQATESIRNRWPAIKVLVLSTLLGRDCLRDLFQAGASGYVLKSSPATELIRAIHATLKGGVYVDPELGNSLLELLHHHPANHPPADKGAALSEREQAILKLLAQGYSNKEIATQLSISVKTVETHKARAMKKQSLNNRVDLIHYAMAQDWLKAS
ncbi:MAG: response regulator transcription factor [Armatimonas sp.]